MLLEKDMIFSIDENMNANYVNTDRLQVNKANEANVQITFLDTNSYGTFPRESFIHLINSGIISRQVESEVETNQD